jgi:hypothetical protein
MATKHSTSSRSLKAKTARKPAKPFLTLKTGRSDIPDARLPDGARAALEWMRDHALKPALDSFIDDPPDEGFECELEGGVS